MVDGIKLENIHPGDKVVHHMSGVGTGIVVDINEIPTIVGSLGGAGRSHLQGGKFIWAKWSDQVGITYTGLGSIVEHHPCRKEYDPTQQPYDEGDI